MQELRSVLEKHGFHFKKQFGQNFISDGNLLHSIVEASGITKDTTVDSLEQELFLNDLAWKLK